MKILIVVDMQNDFVTGPLGTPEARLIVSKVEEKIEQYLVWGDLYYNNVEDPGVSRVIFTRDHHKSNYLKTQEGKFLPIPHCLEGSDGSLIVGRFEGPATYGVNVDYAEKSTFGYNNWVALFKDIKDIESIELVGVCTDICVVSNALILKSLYPEIPIIVDASCCAGTTPENHQAALQVMKSCQIEVVN